MIRKQDKSEDQQPRTEAEIHQSSTRGSATDERLKRIVKQHPQRDEPKVDSIEPGETPPP